MEMVVGLNCRKPHILCAILQELQVDPHMILWILDFLLKRQFVRVNSSTSPVMLTSTGPTQRTEEAKKLYQWCKEHVLQINMRKTKEPLIDFQRKADPVPQLTLNGEAVERVSSYKYLGTIINSDLFFNNNTQTIFKKCQQWIYLVRRLRHLNAVPPILRSFYICHIESLLTLSFLAWYEGLSETNKSKLRTNKSKLRRVITLGSKPSGAMLNPPAAL
eukprot:superscaffoldBa00003888_g17901